MKYSAAHETEQTDLEARMLQRRGTDAMLERTRFAAPSKPSKRRKRLRRPLYPGADTLRWECDPVAREIVRELGALTLDQIAYIMGISRERARQLEMSALRKLALRSGAGLTPQSSHASRQAGEALKELVRHATGTNREIATATGMSVGCVAAIRFHAARKAST